jgi:hypothetical protein
LLGMTSVLDSIPKIVKDRGGKKAGVSRVLLENRILEQKNQCTFCEREFGSPVLIDGQVVILRPEADHFIPQAERRNHSATNISASCQVCNQQIKKSHRFESREQARAIIKQVWDERGYRDCPPLVNITLADIQKFYPGLRLVTPRNMRSDEPLLYALYVDQSLKVA